MKKIITILTIFVITFSLSITINTIFEKSLTANTHNYSSDKTLVIDAGHGGRDGGTIGIDGANEKDINLAIAKKLNDFALVSGCSSCLVRDGDYLVYSDNDNINRSDLYNRLDFINSFSNATMISIHQNHFENEAEWGTQIWFSPNDDVSKSLADYILDTIKSDLQKDNRRENKKSDSSYYILYKAKHPSVMVECGFMSNRMENSNLQNDSYQNKMAFSIFIGYGNFITKEL